jgi:hypothetical protein
MALHNHNEFTPAPGDVVTEIGVDEMGNELWRVESKGALPKPGATIQRNGQWYVVARGAVVRSFGAFGYEFVARFIARAVPAPATTDDALHDRAAVAMYGVRRRFAAKAGLALPEFAALSVADRAAVVAEAAAARSIFEPALLDNPHSQERSAP